MVYSNKLKILIVLLFGIIDCTMKHDYTMPGYIDLDKKEFPDYQKTESIELNKCVFQGWFAKEGNAGVSQLSEAMEKLSVRKIIDVQYETNTKFRYYIPFLKETCIKLKAIAIQ